MSSDTTSLRPAQRNLAPDKSTSHGRTRLSVKEMLSLKYRMTKLPKNSVSQTQQVKEASEFFFSKN